MAAVDYRMVLEQNEYRQCKVLGVKALFHRYVEFDVEKVSATLALVEFEDGTVQKVDPTDVKFLDTKEKMAGFDWGE